MLLINTITEENSNNLESSRLILTDRAQDRPASSNRIKVNFNSPEGQANQQPPKSARSRNYDTNINFESVLSKVFDLYSINYLSVDNDADLVLRKLKFVFTEMPTDSEKQNQVKKEIECLLEAHHYAMNTL